MGLMYINSQRKSAAGVEEIGQLRNKHNYYPPRRFQVTPIGKIWLLYAASPNPYCSRIVQHWYLSYPLPFFDLPQQPFRLAISTQHPVPWVHGIQLSSMDTLIRLLSQKRHAKNRPLQLSTCALDGILCNPLSSPRFLAGL